MPQTSDCILVLCSTFTAGRDYIERTLKLKSFEKIKLVSVSAKNYPAIHSSWWHPSQVHYVYVPGECPLDQWEHAVQIVRSRTIINGEVK